MKIQKVFLLNCIAGALLGCAAGAVAFQANQIARLRGANERLRDCEREVRELSRQNQEIPRLRQEMAAIPGLRAANKGLLAIRNEIHQLRSGKEELAEVRADNQLLQAGQRAVDGQPGAVALPAGAVTKAALVDSGLGSPAATIQTLFWAMCRGDLERMARCDAVTWGAIQAGGGTPEELDQAKTLLRQFGLEPQGQSTEELRQWLAAQTRCFPGYRITGQRALSPEEVEIGVQSLNGGEAMSLRLQRFQGLPPREEWTIEPF